MQRKKRELRKNKKRKMKNRVFKDAAQMGKRASEKDDWKVMIIEGQIDEENRGTETTETSD